MLGADLAVDACWLKCPAVSGSHFFHCSCLRGAGTEVATATGGLLPPTRWWSDRCGDKERWQEESHPILQMEKWSHRERQCGGAGILLQSRFKAWVTLTVPKVSFPC